MYEKNNTSTTNCQFNTQAVTESLGRVCGPSMITVEISELTGKRHDHVMRDTKVMLTEIYNEDSLPKFGESYVGENGQTYPCYRLPKNEVICLVSGYSHKLRMKIIARLEELEKRTSDLRAVLDDPAVMRQILLGYTERVLALEETVQSQSLKVAALDRIATADGSMCVTSAAKHLQIRPKELFKWLVEHKWIYRRQGSKNYLAYQNRIQQGVIEHKVTNQITNEGVERVYTQARVTPKGLAKLSESFEATLV